MIWGKIDLSVSGKFRTLRQMQVFLALSSFQGKNENSNPSLSAIRARLIEHGIDLKERRISQLIGELRDLGLVQTVRRGRGRSNIYDIRSAPSSESEKSSPASQGADESRVSGGESSPASQNANPYTEKNKRKEHLKSHPLSFLNLDPDKPSPVELQRQASILRQREEQERLREEKQRHDAEIEAAGDLLLIELSRRRGVA